MALYHLTVSQIRRSAGQSAIAAAAYRAGECLYSDYYGEYSDYTRKGGVICSEILLPPHAPLEYQDRATLWNTVEQVEKHKKAQLAYSFDIALQNELSMEENIALAREFVQRCLVDKGMVADFAVHAPDKEDGGIPNPHFHVMTTMRPINPDGTWGQKQRREYVLDDEGNRVLDRNGKPMFNAVPTTDWGSPETLEEWREAWCRMVNEKFAKKGLDVRIDHRSYVRQGIDLIPTVHEGQTVRQMEAKGIRTDKGELNRWIKATNRLMLDIKKKIKSLFGWISEVKEELSKPKTPSLADLLISYYQDRNAGAWSQKAKGKNLKEFAEAVNYLMENKLLTLEALESRLSAVSTEFDTLSDTMKAKSARMKELQELIRQAENYKRLKPVYDELNGIKWKKQREKFETAHDADLRLFYTARRILKEKLDRKPITLAAWKQEYDRLQAEYAKLSPQYKPLREDLMKMRRVQYCVDRVLQIREEAKDLPLVKLFKGDNTFTFVAGSSWGPDEDLFLEYFNNHPEMKLIIAPHVIDENHLVEIISKLKRPYVRYTRADEKNVLKADCLIIDCFGLLSSIYRYGEIAYIGGGFGVGIHNTLEAAVYGIPVIFGPKYQKFMEAVQLLEAKGAYSIKDYDELKTLLDRFRTDEVFLRETGTNAGYYVTSNAGATEKIMHMINF